MLNLTIAAFLVGHALVHVSYLAPAPPRTADGPEWPFDMGRSWLATNAGLDAGVVRMVGTVLVYATVALFVAAALAALGWLVPSTWWPALVSAGASASIVALLLFFHPWLVIGLAIDAVLLWAALIADWTPAHIAGA